MTTPEANDLYPELIGPAAAVAMDTYGLDPETAGALIGVVIETWNLPGDLVHQVSRTAADAGYQLDPYQFISDMNYILRPAPDQRT